jgi:hypothetical protein
MLSSHNDIQLEFSSVEVRRPIEANPGWHYAKPTTGEL